MVVRKDLFDKGVKSVEALGDEKLVGRKAVIAATAIGSGTYVYGVYVCKNIKAPDGKPVNDHVEWVGGGASTTMLGGLKGGKFDAIMAVPEWQSAAVSEGFGRPIYDIQDEKAWNRVFGGRIPVTVEVTSSSWWSTFAMPKSSSLGTPSGVTRMLRGLISRCTTRCWWA